MHEILYTAHDALLNARWSDALDMAVVTVVLYSLISWLSRSRARYLSLGVAVLGLGYLIARWLHLSLTLQAFHAALAIAAVALVVLFQEEIRRGLERVVMGSVGRRDTGPRGRRPDVNLLSQTIWRLAANRTGALLVFPGTEPLNRHLDGGIDLDGLLSEPLLLSLFDTSSPGHDGAVIVSGGRIQAFGAHLPLSRRVESDAPFGTRHTAAIGMSERTDALLVTVSEEQGTVHTAIRGELHVVNSEEQLADALTEHIERVSPAPVKRSVSKGLVRNIGKKLTAALASVALWVTLVGPARIVFVRTLSVPVVLRNVPEHFLFEPPRPDHVRVTLSGPREAFRNLDPTMLQVIVPARNLGPGLHRVTVGTNDMKLPDELAVNSVTPHLVAIVARETVDKNLPIRVTTRGSLPNGKLLSSKAINPQRVHVWVPKSMLGTLTHLDTLPVDLGAIDHSTKVEQPVSLPSGVRFRAGEPAKVTVSLEVSDR